ncbi:MAG: phospho-N-acetylmuramoyl-pentapeptide-transferase [Oscillospiraceae bacterium]
MSQYAQVVAAVVALLVSALVGKFLVPFLRKMHFGQTINEIGPKWHKKKQGIPTMGGFMFIIGAILALLVAYPLLGQLGEQADNLQLVVLALVTTLAFSAVGFLDDYLKVAHKNNLGLNAKGKLVLQSGIAICFMVALHFAGRLSTVIMLPVVGGIDLGWLFYPLAFVLIVGMVNAVNLTDGLDGLAGSVTFWVMCGYMVLMLLAGQQRLSVLAAALAGGCAGFLVWNFYPAKVFMGDTGSMFLGGAVVTLGFCMGSPELVIVLGLVYLLEALSVMIQVTYFKLTHGKRLFKMTPIHHHFEMLGWSEIKIIVLFCIVTIICVALACVYGFLVF